MFHVNAICSQTILMNAGQCDNLHCAAMLILSQVSITLQALLTWWLNLGLNILQRATSVSQIIYKKKDHSASRTEASTHLCMLV